MSGTLIGYFIIPAADFVEDKQLIGAPDYVSLSDTRNFNEILALQYFEEKCPEPKTVGFFYAEDWSENDYLKNKNTSATFRIRSVLLEEFKEICSEKDLSQTEIISDILWDFNRNFRLKTGNPYRSWKISLPDGTVWPPQSEEDF